MRVLTTNWSKWGRDFDSPGLDECGEMAFQPALWSYIYLHLLESFPGSVGFMTDRIVVRGRALGGVDDGRLQIVRTRFSPKGEEIVMKRTLCMWARKERRC